MRRVHGDAGIKHLGQAIRIRTQHSASFYFPELQSPLSRRLRSETRSPRGAGSVVIPSFLQCRGAAELRSKLGSRPSLCPYGGGGPFAYGVRPSLRGRWTILPAPAAHSHGGPCWGARAEAQSILSLG